MTFEGSYKRTLEAHYYGCTSALTSGWLHSVESTPLYRSRSSVTLRLPFRATLRRQNNAKAAIGVDPRENRLLDVTRQNLSLHLCLLMLDRPEIVDVDPAFRG